VVPKFWVALRLHKQGTLHQAVIATARDLQNCAEARQTTISGTAVRDSRGRQVRNPASHVRSFAAANSISERLRRRAISVQVARRANSKSFDATGEKHQEDGTRFAMFFRTRRSGRWLSTAVVVILFLAAPPPTADPQTPRQAAISKAKYLAWLNNWSEAARILDRLSSSDLGPVDEATALFARAAHIRGNIERLPLPTAADEIASLLASNTAHSDSDLRLYLLAIRGDIEFQFSLRAAQKTWEEARQVASGAGHREWKARAEGELGTIAFLNGEIFTAATLVSRALLKAELAHDVAAQIRYRTALGEGLAQFGRAADALRFYDKALALAKATEGAYFPFTAYLGKARLLASSGREQEGLNMLRDGLLDARRKNLKVREARILTVLGDLESARGDQREAIKCLSAAAEVARGAGLDRIEADASTALASRLRDAGNVLAAKVYAKRGVAAARRARDVYHLPQMLAILAEIERANRNFRAADATYSEATDVVHALFRDFPHPKHKNTLIATMSRVFQGHFALALNSLQDVPKAFAILESARALGLVDLLRASDVHYAASSWNQSAARRIAVLQRALSSEADPHRRKELLDRLWELEVRSFRPRTSITEGVHEVPVAKPVPIQRFRSTLADGELVIEYVLGRSRSFALAISRDRVAHYELKGRNEIESVVDLHLTAMRSQQGGRVEARALYRLLLEPASALLSQSKRLVIVPDGKLHLLPFDALLDAAGRYVVETQVISYAPSATAYYLLSATVSRQSVQASVLSVGGARYASRGVSELQSSWRESHFFSASRRPWWSPIPQSLVEVNDVANSGIGKALLLTGEEATEAQVKRLPLSTFRVLHFALHSTMDDEFPDRSALVLSSSPFNQEDDLLQAREIVSLNLNADLVTLSACDAGAGTIEGIAGMNSLVQAFMMAGSRSVVASVWPAEDMFTAALMRRFYANLRQGFDKAEALTLAKRDLLSRNGPDALPFLWAGFRLVGDAHGTVSGE
jgi:CHAT domain-containing protein/tetratricopeptide (TPR) repeat protein